MTNSSPDQTSARDSESVGVNAIIASIRVPELPYPVSRSGDSQSADWVPLLQSCWNEQRDERVVDVLRAVDVPWSVRQVNAGYLADRIMDIFLQTSGLHETLVVRVARLRFLLAWRIDAVGKTAFGSDSRLHDWLDGLHALRGWRESSGRSARQTLGWLEKLLTVVDSAFHERSMSPFDVYVEEWSREEVRKGQRVSKLRTRLLETETGAARQRLAEQTVRALMGRALSSRQLPPAIISFIDQYWAPLLRQVIWADGLKSDNTRHARKLLEWIIWVSDPCLSDSDRDRLYQVGEHLSDKIREVYQRIVGDPLPPEALTGLEQTLVSRLRGEAVEVVPAPEWSHDPAWLQPATPNQSSVNAYLKSWFVEGEGRDEQRRFLLDFLIDTGELVWTNGEGVKLGLMDWADFEASVAARHLRPLPPLNHFGDVFAETTQALGQVLQSQLEKRRQAREKARQRAEAIRAEQEAAKLTREAEEAARRAEAERQQALQAHEQQVAEQEQAARAQREREQTARDQVDRLKLGEWIELGDQNVARSPEGSVDAGDNLKLKLAVRINASGKLVFVDRLGLNRTQLTIKELQARLVEGHARILSSEAEFEDTLSRVIGRIRVGR